MVEQLTYESILKVRRMFSSLRFVTSLALICLAMTVVSQAQEATQNNVKLGDPELTS